ncbi:MAG: hypothetical protein ACOC2W_00860 [bacterium]
MDKVTDLNEYRENELPFTEEELILMNDIVELTDEIVQRLIILDISNVLLDVENGKVVFNFPVSNYKNKE